MTDKTAIEAIEDAMLTICKLCKRLNPQHTGDPKTCDCYDIGFLRKALAAIEAEKPAETGTARLVAQSIIGMALADYSGLERQLENDTLISIEWIQQYAESYHAEQCKACKK